MSSFIQTLFTDKCPHCQEALIIENHTYYQTTKICPNGHYTKEIHRPIESVIEYDTLH